MDRSGTIFVPLLLLWGLCPFTILPSLPFMVPPRGHEIRHSQRPSSHQPLGHHLVSHPFRVLFFSWHPCSNDAEITHDPVASVLVYIYCVPFRRHDSLHPSAFH
ncbi:hypothetical protein BJV78DRAFT_1245055 [Lactifluus subvellereus]|nr:hypothetical protein BJV78DRAFT_1245055 [Lactifluus subvellereus]